jgi:hypothetical protein
MAIAATGISFDARKIVLRDIELRGFIRRASEFRMRSSVCPAASLE